MSDNNDHNLTLWDIFCFAFILSYWTQLTGHQASIHWASDRMGEGQYDFSYIVECVSYCPNSRANVVTLMAPLQ